MYRDSVFLVDYLTFLLFENLTFSNNKTLTQPFCIEFPRKRISSEPMRLRVGDETSLHLLHLRAQFGFCRWFRN